MLSTGVRSPVRSCAATALDPQPFLRPSGGRGRLTAGVVNRQKNDALALRRAATELEAARDVDGVMRIVTGRLAPLGIEHVIYITVAADGGAPILLSTLDLHEAGIDEDTTPFDPFLDYCCNSYEVTSTGVEFMKDYPYLGERDRAFIQRAGEMGFRSGLGIPVRLVGSPLYGGFNLGTAMEREEFERRIVPLSDALRAFCLIAHRRVQEVAEPPEDRPAAGTKSIVLRELTSREMDVLAEIAKGASRRICARRLGLSEHTVAAHTRRIYGKLSVGNRVEAAAIAMREGLVEPAAVSNDPLA